LFEAKIALNIGYCFLSSMRREQGAIFLFSPFWGEGRVRGNKGSIWSKKRE
jgi:hypothetical protein